jgi:peptide/nickel transport system substrate-binding protein
MKRIPASRVYCLTLAILLVGCSQPGAGTADRSATDTLAAREPKRITAAISGQIANLRSQLNPLIQGSLPGSTELEELVHAGLAIEDHQGMLRPQLADAVPSAENGLWKVFADGRMETTWRIKPGALWHDGAPITADDFVFAALVSQDKDLPEFRHRIYNFVDQVEAADPSTLTVTWKQPFIQADSMFAQTGSPRGLPLPKHILASAYETDKGTFTQLPYWSSEFVGAGPYVLREWVPGSRLVLEANDRYVLGRPNIDRIEVLVIQDRNTLVANLLAGAVDLPLGSKFSFGEILPLQAGWRGRIDVAPGGSSKIWPQLLHPSPDVIGDVRFRRALLHAIDRQELAETLTAGQVPVADSTLLPTDREFRDLETAVVRYPFDPRKAEQIIEELGYAKGADGVFQDIRGNKVAVELRLADVDFIQKTGFSAADYWRKVGVATDPVTIPNQRQGDSEYRATFPGFDTSRSASSVDGFKSFLSSEQRLPGNRYVGSGRTGYMNPELDALIERYFVTIPWNQRMEVGRQIVRQLSDQVLVMNLVYDAVPTPIAQRLINVPLGASRWNAHEWNLAP